MSTEILSKAEEILSQGSIPDRHTFFQIEKFVIGKEPTGQAQLWAIHRELQAKYETVQVYKKDLADAEDNLELFDIRIERLNRIIREEAQKAETFTDLNIQEHEINIRKLQREKELLVKGAQKATKKLKCVLEEIDFLIKGYEKIVAQIGPMKPLDDEEAQREMWNEKLLEDFNLRVILQRPLDPEFVKTVMCLHDDAPVKKHVINLIDHIQMKMLAERQKVEALPEAKRPSVEPKAKVSR